MAPASLCRLAQIRKCGSAVINAETSKNIQSPIFQILSAMLITHLWSTTLLALLSCTNTNIVQYAVLSFLVSYSGMLLTRPLLPSARMVKLENIVAETTDIFQSAKEERMLSNREFNLEVQLRLSRVNLTKSILRPKILEFELGYPAKEYLHIVGSLSAEIERCKRELKEIQIDILTEMEIERQLLYNTKIDEIVVVLALRGASKLKETQV
ncbi:hypothetical protein B0H12DRAFT_33714 [Mycena haematopus]|nr:hypothetical protein B0H12DRAFT_33714 [Mycena haematopus]